MSLIVNQNRKLAVLNALADGPLLGRDVSRLTGISRGMINPILNAMEGDGLIASNALDRSGLRGYSITDKGKREITP